MVDLFGLYTLSILINIVVCVAPKAPALMAVSIHFQRPACGLRPVTPVTSIYGSTKITDTTLLYLFKPKLDSKLQNTSCFYFFLPGPVTLSLFTSLVASLFASLLLVLLVSRCFRHSPLATKSSKQDTQLLHRRETIKLLVIMKSVCCIISLWFTLYIDMQSV